MTAVRTACAIASEYGYRLYPLNPERYFVADALIRSCFELGNPKSAVLGTGKSSFTSGHTRRGLLLELGCFAKTGSGHTWSHVKNSQRKRVRARVCVSCGVSDGRTGVDPSTQSTLRRRLALMVVGTLCALKIVLLGVLIKQVMGAVLPASWSVWAVSYAALLSSCFWDTLVCRVIMEQVALTAAVRCCAPSRRRPRRLPPVGDTHTLFFRSAGVE